MSTFGSPSGLIRVMAMTGAAPSLRSAFHRNEIGSGSEAPIAQLAEAADLKSAQSGFESQWGHCKDLVGVLRTYSGGRGRAALPAFYRRAAGRKPC